MKAKTIKKIIRAKVDAWLASSEDESTRSLASKNTIVTGGAIASMLLKEHVNDYDLYFRDMATAEAVASYYVKKFQEANGYPLSLDVQDGRIRITTDTGHRGETAGDVETLGTDQIDDVYEEAEAAALETVDD